MLKIGTLVIDGWLTLLTDNLTSVMSNLEESDNEDLYKLINFLYVYIKRDKYQQRFSELEYKELEKLYDFYQEIIQNIRVNSTDYIAPNFNNLNNTNKIPQHANTISIFNQLSDTQQKNIINLAKFLVYCRQNNSNHLFLKQSEELMRSIKNYSKF